MARLLTSYMPQLDPLTGVPQTAALGGILPPAQPVDTRSAPSTAPQVAPLYPPVQAPDLSQAGLTDDERLLQGLSVFGDLAEQLDRAHRRGKLSKWARLRGQDVSAGGLDTGARQLRAELAQRPAQRRQEMIQQYGLAQSARQEQMQQDMLDPSSEISQRAQQGPMGELLRRYGFNDRTIMAIPAGQMQSIEGAARAAHQISNAQEQFDAQMAQERRRFGYQKRQDMQAQENWQQSYGLDERRFDESSRHNRAMEGMSRRAASAGAAKRQQQQAVAQAVQALAARHPTEMSPEERAEAMRMIDQLQATGVSNPQLKVMRDRFEQFEQQEVPGLRQGRGVTSAGAREIRQKLAGKQAVRSAGERILEKRPEGFWDSISGSLGAGPMNAVSQLFGFGPTEAKLTQDQVDAAYGALDLGLKAYFALGAITKSDSDLMGQLRGKSDQERRGLINDLSNEQIRSLMTEIERGYRAAAEAEGYRAPATPQPPQRQQTGTTQGAPPAGMADPVLIIPPGYGDPVWIPGSAWPEAQRAGARRAGP